MNMQLRSLLTSLILLAVLALTPILQAQVLVQPTNETISISGIEYYNHTVLAGQTPYSIARAYGVVVEDIFKANPGAETGISKGQKLLIPVAAQVAREGELHDGYIRHKVKKQETIYGISREYDVTQEELIAANPGLANGIKTGDILRIPVQRAMAPAIVMPPQGNDSLVEHIVQKRETLYSLSRTYNVSIEDIKRYNPDLSDGLKRGQTILIPLKKKKIVVPTRIPDAGIFNRPAEALPCSPRLYNRTFNIVLILQLRLWDVYSIDTHGISPDKIDPSDYSSLKYLQFYEGFMMAMDSLKNIGMNIDLTVIDLPTDSVNFELMLRKPELKAANMIIGPEDQSAMMKLSIFAAQNKIYLVNPWFNSDKYTEGLQYTLNLVPQVTTQLFSISQYLLDSISKPNFIIVHDKLPRNLWVAEQVESTLATMLAQSGYPDSSWTVVNYPKQGLSGVKSALMADKRNVVITASMNEAFISSYVSLLDGLNKTYPITLVGMPWWRNYRRIETQYLQNLDLHLFSRYYINYEDPAVISFISDFRNKYKTEPDPNEFLAFRGFDIGMFFAGALYYYGPEPDDCFNNSPYRPMYTEFRLQDKPGSGYENQFINIYRLREFKQENVSRLQMITQEETPDTEGEHVEPDEGE